MKIALYSDLHLEHKHGWHLPADFDADVLILAGDIISFRDFNPLALFLNNWRKPVLFVAGNHEYYRASISGHNAEFRAWAGEYLPQVHFLNDESISIDGVHFFGGTMWTDFEGGNEWAMQYAERGMYDFELIRERGRFTPRQSLELHKAFATALDDWFTSVSKGPRVVITHHAPVVYPNTKHVGSPLESAFNCTDMLPIIEKHQPDVWIYGHTHECGEQVIGKTRIIANQLGYVRPSGSYECWDRFDKYGCVVHLCE